MKDPQPVIDYLKQLKPQTPVLIRTQLEDAGSFFFLRYGTLDTQVYGEQDLLVLPMQQYFWDISIHASQPPVWSIEDSPLFISAGELYPDPQRRPYAEQFVPKQHFGLLCNARVTTAENNPLIKVGDEIDEWMKKQYHLTLAGTFRLGSLF